MKIELVEGMLTLPTAKGEIILEELPMAQYERFYRHWLSAINIARSEDNESETFSTLFTANESFRNHMWKAMQILGVPDPGMLSPRVMNALLWSYEGGLPLAFRLHEETPSLKKKPMPTKKRRGFLKRLRNSISGAMSQLAYSVNQVLFTSGAYAIC